MRAVIAGGGIGGLMIGADGIHSALRACLYPDEGPPSRNGHMLWRGATDWPVYADGRTQIIAGGNDAKLVYYPIHAEREAIVRGYASLAGYARSQVNRRAG